MNKRLPYLLKFTAIFAILASMVILESCSSGKKALGRGNYYESVMLSINRLRRNPDHKKSRETLSYSYPLSLQFYEENVRNLQARNDPNKWTGIMESYSRINSMYEEIRRAPGALKVIPNPKNYYNELADARNNAAEESYQIGLAEMSKNTRMAGKEAYRAFQRADGFVNGYKDVTRKMEDAYWLATLKVLIAPIPVTNARVQLSANFMEDKIHEYLKTNPVDEFVRFMTPADLEQLNMMPDQVLQLHFDEFTIGEVYTVEKQIEASKDSVVLATVNAPNLAGNFTSGNNSSVNTNNNTTNNNSSTTNNTTNNTNNTTNNTTNNSSSTTNNTTNNTSNTTNNNTNNNSSTTNNTNNTTNNTTDNTSNTTNNTNNSSSTTNNTSNNNSSSSNDSSSNTNTGNTGDNSSSNNSNTSTGGNNSNSSTNTGDSGKSDRNTQIQICHKAGVTNLNLKVPESALGGHLKHGDAIFACNTDLSKVKVRVCHSTGASGKTQSLEISANALSAHLEHGDVLGGCDGSSYMVEVKDSKENKGDDSKDKDNNGKGKGNGSDQPMLFASLDNGMNMFNYAEVEIDTNINVYGTVKAKVFIFEKTLRSYGTMDFKVLDANTNSVVSAEKLNGEYIWQTKWGYFNGDERALTAEQLQIMNTREAVPPTDQDMFIGFTRPIFDQLVNKLQRFYSQY